MRWIWLATLAARIFLGSSMLVTGLFFYAGQYLPVVHPIALAQELNQERHMVSCMHDEWRHGQDNATDITVDGSLFLRDGIANLNFTCGHWYTYLDTSGSGPKEYALCLNWNDHAPLLPGEEKLEGQVVMTFPPRNPFLPPDKNVARVVCFGTRFKAK